MNNKEPDEQGRRVLDSANGSIAEFSAGSAKRNFRKRLRKMLYIYIALMLVLVFSSKTVYSFSLPKVTAAMPESGALTKELTARGVIAFAETFDIYADSSGQIDEIRVKKGGSIDVNSVIAVFKATAPDGSNQTTELDFTIERIENQLAVLTLNKSAAQDKLRALSATTNDLYSYQCAVEDAKAVLFSAQATLDKARESAETEFDDNIDQQTIADAERDLNRGKADLIEAETALAEAKAGNAVSFDDFSYQQNINDTAIALERRKEELKDVNAALDAAKQAGTSAFDDYSYRDAINAANTAYDRSLEDYNEALRQYNLAVQHYYDALYSSADDMETAAAQKDADAAQNRVTSVKRTLDDTDAALDKSINDLARAENTFYTSNGLTQQKSVAEAERQVKQAKNAVEDAQRAYDKAIDELERAKKAFGANTDDAKRKAVSDAEKNVTAAQRAVDDAQRIYDRSTDDLSRAAAKAADEVQTNITEAETNLQSAQTALARAETNFELAQKALSGQTDEAQKSLELELKRVDLDIERVNIDLRAAVASNSGDGSAAVTSDYSGIVVSVDKAKGQFVAQGEKVAAVGANNHLFICEISCPESDGRFIEIGDEAAISAKGVTAAVKAIVTDIAPVGDTLKIILSCETDGLSGGEYVAVKFHKQTRTYDALVPNEAVFHEGMSNYVWVIRSRVGALGVEYYSVKIKVLVADSDEYYTAISKGLEFFEPVAVSFNKALTVSGRVRRLEKIN
ncbi:MAG: HlyD family efflux transporter periplasmic adaptor subunit [Clostridiales bacterium]|nr:HlyD family efflux transporter periplasmic adaptor subunit [Clostridiales bacterium]